MGAVGVSVGAHISSAEDGKDVFQGGGGLDARTRNGSRFEE